MGVRDAIAALFGDRNRPAQIEWIGPTFRSLILGLTPEELYRTQPHLRIVLSFVARNIAHLGLHAFGRDGNDRTRLRTGSLADLLKQPNPTMTQFELLETLALDLGLYDIAYWMVVRSNEMRSGWRIQPIPPSWVEGQKGGTAFAPASYVVTNPDGVKTDVPTENMLVFHGWNPGRPKDGTSPVETLKQVLAEQVQAWAYREQVWQRGGRVGAYMTRPKDSPWSDAARERFARDWKARWTGMDGAKAGGTPILEDGMDLKRLGFSAREEEWAEVAKVALSTVAAVYHVNPVMVGVIDDATFSSTREFRKMLYSETLGPQLARIEDRINAFLVPKITTDDVYVEFNIEEKLQGDFEEQAALMSTATGAPWMTRNEARARRNLPALKGGDELVVPLNVLVGGQASPRDSGEQNEKLHDLGELRVPLPAKKSLRAKTYTRDTQHQKALEVVRAFFDRQSASVLSALGAKAAGDWWDEARWDSELAEDLFALALSLSKAIGEDVAQAIGFSASDYDVARTEAFLREVAQSRAGAINAATREQLSAILAGDGPDGVTDPAHVFEKAGSRAEVIAGTFVTTVAAFSTIEAGKQTGAASKTWLVTSKNPRASHAAMNGQTTGIDEPFSNGAKWPGDPVLGVDGVAGCTCDVEVTFG